MPETTAAAVPRLFVSVEEAARSLGIGRTTAWTLVRNGELRSVAIGARRLVAVDDIRAYADRLLADA